MNFKGERKLSLRSAAALLLALVMLIMLAACTSAPASEAPQADGASAKPGSADNIEEELPDAGEEGSEPEAWVPSENDEPRYSVEEGNPFTAIEGMYQDEVGQRASMVLYAYEDTGAIVEVSWADSAFETVTWTMYAEMAEDGNSFTYEACEKHKLTFTEDGDITDETIYTDGTGSFVIYNNHIDWIDDQEDAGAGVRFVFVDTGASGGI